jgi:hypothetical protein
MLFLCMFSKFSSKSIFIFNFKVEVADRSLVKFWYLESKSTLAKLNKLYDDYPHCYWSCWDKTYQGQTDGYLKLALVQGGLDPNKTNLRYFPL